MSILFLLFISLLPGVILLFYIFYMDRNEKEPTGLIMRALVLGALSIFIALIVEVGFESVHPIFQDSKQESLVSAFLKSFVQIAPIEEFSKLIVVLLFIWKKPEFNEENDGIVYVSASALGFAMFENIFYVMEGGLSVGILRSITAMPLHCFTGVIMGYYVGLAKFAPSSSESRNKIILGFLIAVFIHGIYDTFALSGTNIVLLLIPTVILLIFFGIKTLKKGRELSLIRWENNPPTIETRLSSEPEPTEKKSPVSGWRVWISRPLLLLCISFWMLIFTGIIFDSDKEDIYSLIAGTVIITFLPTLIAVFLEISHYRHKRQNG